MKDHILSFVRENASTVIPVELEFGTIHNIITLLNEVLKSNDTPDNVRNTLSYCNTSLIFRTIDKFPQCAFIYYKETKETLEYDDTENDSEYDED